MDNWKAWVFDSSNRPFVLLGLLVLFLVLPIALILVNQSQNNRSSAASPDKLEAEGGTLTSTGVSKQNDSQASGGQFVLFQSQINTPTNSPTSIPGTGGIYGPGMGMNSLANTNAGGNGVTRLTMRFRAEHSSALNSFRTYIQSYDHPGYGAGTGGTIRTTLQSDDGTSNHFPSGTVLATAPNLVHPISNAGQVFTFSTPYTLTKGILYHIVFENIDPSPNTNYFSGNYFYNPTQPNQPRFGNPTEWGHAYYYNGGWIARSAYSPILDITYANGVHQGMGYMELGSVQKIGGVNSVRERITPTTTRTFTEVGIRLRRTSGSSPLIISLGNQLVNIPASSVAIASASRATPGTWATATFPSPVTLTAGQTYYLTLSAASGTEYSLDAIRKGASYGYHASTRFPDGYAERNTGSGWAGFPSPWASSPTTEADLQFYLR